MLRAKNIIYGYCLRTTPNKYKYLISIYRSDDLNIVAVFPTSQKRSGSSSPVHGINMRDGNIVSYVFKGNVTIGNMPNSEEPFSFPLDTTIPFDYCFWNDSQEDILKKFRNPEIVGILSDKEYIDLVYAFLNSPLTPNRYRPIMDKILKEYLDNGCDTML